jgi:hypothetical protein
MAVKMLLSFIAMVCIISSLNGCRSATPTQVTPTAPASTETVTQKPEPSADEDLVAAALRGDLAVVHSLLAKGADVNAKGTEGITALIAASAKGPKEMVQALLDRGADVNAQADQGATALMVASERGRTEIVSALLAKGADVNARMVSNGAGALLLAAQHGHREVVDVLLTAGADVNAKATNGATALIAASQNGHKEVVVALLHQGADINAKTNDGRTALGIAKQQGKADIIAVLQGVGATTLTWATVLTSNDLDIYAQYLKENPKDEHLAELRMLIDNWLRERVSTLERQGRKVIRNASTVPVGYSLDVPGAIPRTLAYLQGGKQKLATHEWYSDPTRPLSLMLTPDKVEHREGRGVAIIDNVVYTFGF